MKILVTVLVLALMISVIYTVHDHRQSTAEIDRSLQQLNTELKRAQNDDSLYSRGLIKALIALRVQTIEDTISMLEQKRQSLLHRICLSYDVAGIARKPASVQDLKRIEQDIVHTQNEIDRARAENAQYSGGFVKALIEMRVATEQETLAGLNQHYLFAKYGLPNLTLAGGTLTSAPARPTTPDKGAL